MAMHRRQSVVRPSSSTISVIFFSEMARPIKLKFHFEPPWIVALKFEPVREKTNNLGSDQV